MSTPEPGRNVDVDADPVRLASSDDERPATSDPDAMRDDLGEDPNAANEPGDDAGGAG